MKTFIASIIILALLISLVFGFSHIICERLAEICLLALGLPQSAEGFDSEVELLEKTEKLFSLWSRSMEFLPYTISYDMLDRADEAVLALFAAAEARCCEDFLAARLRFLDSVQRLHAIFGFSLSSVF